MIVHRTTAPIFIAWALLLGGGCYTAELDRELTGLFACDEDGDEASASCPSGQTCVNHRCEDAEELPTLVVLAPEDEQSLTGTVFDLIMGMPPGPAIDVTMTFQGSLELASAGGDHEFGEGHVVVYVDGDEQLEVMAGDISASMALQLKVNPVTGPHRIVIQAVRNDGIPYDNPEATSSRLFWLQNDNPDIRRPFVAIKSPWPGSVFGPESQAIQVDLAVLNFDLIDPNPDSEPELDGQGHAHIYYDEGFPQCLENPACDGGYLGVTGQSQTIEVTLPPSGVGEVELTAVLRHMGHTPYGFPFGCDPVNAPLDLCMPVLETIQLLRVED